MIKKDTRIKKFDSVVDTDDRVLQPTYDEKTGILLIEVFKPCTITVFNNHVTELKKDAN